MYILVTLHKISATLQCYFAIFLLENRGNQKFSVPQMEKGMLQYFAIGCHHLGPMSQMVKEKSRLSYVHGSGLKQNLSLHHAKKMEEGCPGFLTVGISFWT